MESRRHTKVTTETHETTIIRLQRSPLIYCESCQMNTQHLSILQAELCFSLSGQAIRRLAVKRQIHSIWGTDGSLLLCCDSIAKQLNK